MSLLSPGFVLVCVCLHSAFSVTFPDRPVFVFFPCPLDKCYRAIPLLTQHFLLEEQMLLDALPVEKEKRVLHLHFSIG